MTMTYLATLLGILALAAGVRYLLRLRRETASPPLEVTDDLVRQIEREGVIETGEDEPLDWERIEEEEELFWDEERWDRADPL